MALMDFFRKKNSGEVAKDRLKLLLISDRANCSPEVMEAIKNDIIKVITKYMDIDSEGLDIQIIKIADVSVLADYMVIATGTSSTHVKALADEVEYKLDQAGISVSHIEGYRSNSWILLDYIDVIVNVFDDEARDFYDLERLWQDGESVDLTGIVD